MRMSVAVRANHLQKRAGAAYPNGAVAAVGGTRPVVSDPIARVASLPKVCASIIPVERTDVLAG
jgi:hypothetical protein